MKRQTTICQQPGVGVQVLGVAVQSLGGASGCVDECPKARSMGRLGQGRTRMAEGGHVPTQGAGSI